MDTITPKSVFVLNEPSPRKAKLRISPPKLNEPMLMVTPSEAKETISSVALAPVLITRPVV